MSYELSSLDLHYLLAELRVLEGARVDKIYSPEKKELLIQLFISGKGRKILRINAPGYIYLTDFKEEQPERPSGFCTLLRKYLDNTRLREIRQLGFERIVEMVFEGKEGNYRLIAELFSKGNIVLCRDDLTIIMPAERQDWKGRSVRPKLKYISPSRELNFLELTEKELREAAQASGKSVVKLLAVDLGLGGRYAEEICAVSGIPKEKTGLDGADIKKIIAAKDRLISERPEAVVYLEAGKLKATSPFRLESLNGLESKDFQSFNEAMDYVFTSNIAQSSDSKKLSKHQARVDRLSKIVATQEGYLTELEKEIEEETRKGEAIYSNYQMITEILKELSKARAKYSLKEMKEKVKGNKVVKDIKEKEKSAVLEL